MGQLVNENSNIEFFNPANTNKSSDESFKTCFGTSDMDILVQASDIPADQDTDQKIEPG